jgi:putative CocE/NonD family hydrolase
MTVIGPIKLVLHAATDGVDTDWTAKLVDVAPSGYAMNLCDGIVRTRYRDSFKKPEMLTPSEIYEYEFDVGVTGNVFKAGHQIRLEVSSSNFPRYDRNLNTGEDNGTSTEMRSAEQTVHHSAARPSHIVLPIIPA